MITRIFILDDFRSIDQACKNGGVDLASIKRPNFTLVRPFRWDGVEVISDFQDAAQTIVLNERYDIWILDNDLGPELEGLTFLKLMITDCPNKIPDKLVSCSANFNRAKEIELTHKDFLAQREAESIFIDIDIEDDGHHCKFKTCEDGEICSKDKKIDEPFTDS